MSRLRRSTPTLIALVVLLLALAVGVRRSGLDEGDRSGPFPESAATPAGAGRDLAADEAAGGHTLSRHVGLDAGKLRARLEREPSLAVASSFHDRATAERAVAALLRERAAAIDRWLDGGRGERLAIAGMLPGAPLGLTLRRSARRPEPAHGVRAVLIRRGRGYFVLTAYPEKSR